jgi:YesN/AraC family two-component response regulator
MSEQQFLKDWQREAVLFIEKHHNTTGAMPSDDDIIDYLRFLKFKVNSVHIEELKNSELFQASMEVRGLTFNDEPNKLTAKQMAAASVMLNLTDRRSDEKKLRDIGVSTEEFTNWLQDNQFAEYMRERSELMINNSVHLAHMGLLRGVNQGNTASIKLYYELTGRYNPNEEQNVNIRILIAKMLEVIQKHVRDPNTLNQLAVEFSQIAIEAGAPVANNTVISAHKELS